MEIRFDGKTAVVFGGSRGIGKAIAVELAKAGATLYIASRQLANAVQTCDELKALGYNAVAEAVEVTDYAQVDGFLEKAQKETGQLDIVINNAGIVGTTPYLDATPEEIQRLFDVNVMGVNHGCQAAIKRMIPAEGGKIVNIASFAGRRAMRAGFAHYGMSKSAVIYLTQAAAYAASPYNINVNAVCPGIIRTDMWEQILDAMLEGNDRDREEVWKESLDTFIPLARGDQKPEDIAYTILFLCSTYADHITGQSVNVDGGGSMD